MVRSPPIPRPTPRRRGSQSSLPPSSSPIPFSDTDDNISPDEREAVQDVDGEDEDEDGEDLFAQNLEE